MKSRVRIFVILSILVGIVPCSSFAQKGKTAKSVDTTIVLQENLPAEVTKAFKKRFATATNVVWRAVDGNFVVECTARNVPTEATFKKDGVWLSTTEELEPNTLPSACVKSISAYFQKYTLVSYKRTTESDKNVTLTVGIYESQNAKKKLETKVLLDKVGAIIRTISPEEPDEETAAETEDATVDKKSAKQEAKAKKELDKDSRLEAHPIKISESELPPSLLRWISLRYPDYVYKEILYTEDSDFEDEGNLYRLKIQRSGVGQSAYATVWFTRDGDFLKVDDPFRTEEELQNAEKAAMEKEKANTSQSEDDSKTKKAKAKQEESSEPIITEGEAPDEYRAAMKLKYPRIKEVTWGEDEEGNWIAFYTDQAGKNEVFFEQTDSVRWLETKTPIADLNRVPFAARSYVEKNYPKQVSIKRAWNVKSAKVKPYVIVELYDKKLKITDIVQFWQTGKLKE